MVHAGYAKRRKALLEAGVRLFELKAIAPESPHGGALVGSSGSSAASLHAKTFAVDRARVFVGSFNFDPRSAHLNTEMGLVIDSPPLAQRIAGRFERNGNEELRHDTEPGTAFWKRAAVRFLSMLPIEWLL